MSPAIRFLIIANIAAFALFQLVGAQFYDLFGLVPVHVWQDRWVWQVATYLFIHGSVFQLLFNLLALWMFAMPIESQWGSWEFLKYYFLCGIGAGVVSVALQPHSTAHIIGASGAIYGLLVAYAMLYPDAVVYLYFFFPIKASHMAILFGLIEFFAGATDATPGIARFTHLSGMIIGYVYIRWWWELELRAKSYWTQWTGSMSGQSSRKSSRITPAPKKPAAREDENLDEEVNRILDKISASGQQSLSSEELDILRRESKRKQSKWGNA